MDEKMIGIIGGTGIGDILAERMSSVKTHREDTPFGKTSDQIVQGRLGRHNVAFVNRHGKGHKFSPGSVPYAANIYAMKKLGVAALISIGAVGSLREQIEPGHLVLVDQFIDKTFKRRTSFFEDIAAAHCELAQPTCRRLRNLLTEQAKGLDVKTHPKGCYVCMEGPQFSTRSESLMHRTWGADLVGMTAMPEAKLAREAQICYGLIALVSDYDCWRPHEENKDTQTLLAEIRANLQNATENCLTLVEKILQADNTLADDNCHCRKSLDLAVWTSSDQIENAKWKQLDVLFQ